MSCKYFPSLLFVFQLCLCGFFPRKNFYLYVVVFVSLLPCCFQIWGHREASPLLAIEDPILFPSSCLCFLNHVKPIMHLEFILAYSVTNGSHYIFSLSSCSVIPMPFFRKKSIFSINLRRRLCYVLSILMKLGLFLDFLSCPLACLPVPL